MKLKTEEHEDKLQDKSRTTSRIVSPCAGAVSGITVQGPAADGPRTPESRAGAASQPTAQGLASAWQVRMEAAPSSMLCNAAWFPLPFVKLVGSTTINARHPRTRHFFGTISFTIDRSPPASPSFLLAIQTLDNATTGT